MIVTFQKEYLQELYTKGKASNKHYRFQPEVVRKYTKVIGVLQKEVNVLGLTKYGSLHYEHLHGDKEGLSSVLVDGKYRIEFTESICGDSTIANICNITRLSNHYK